ncbi:mammalian cell entry protein [Mycobacterium sp. E136]|uniref:MCE family protein n=1 Tax=Mycobacterium sp. E136 TaxID=1834125 RepID=UPI0007FC87D6|nr:MlaD family protein [Mycobacterium sp. E136]OBG92434.1 mammalian cell entry protein [Mycobacterium sp. E136]
MTLTRRIWIQLIVVATIALFGVAIMFFPILQLPALLFGVGQYTVTAQLPEAGGLYERGNVTYRGYQVGRVESVGLTGNGVEAVLSLDSDVEIPSDVKAEVHSVSAIGEQYIDLIPQSEGSPPLKDGDVIARDQTSVPPNISSLLSATNKGLQAIPQDNLKTVVDEAYIAFGGLGPEIARFLKGASALALDAKANVNELTTLVDKSKPLLDTQTETSGSIEAWAANLATVTDQLRDQDADVATVLKEGPGAADEVRALFSQLQPTLPVVLANLASVAEVAAVYRPNLEQLLVLLPQGAAIVQASGVPNRNTKVDYPGAYLSFNLNLNLPPACTTGFLPAQQRRAAAHEDYPPVPEGDMYCRVPQDSPFNVRGARNTPCVQKPGKRAPTAKMCESDEEFVPLNDGYAWKGDPNATLSGQSVPAPRDPAAPGAGLPDPAPAPPVAVAEYDPASGQYMAPDGKMYTQSDLGAAGGPKSWQDMLAPPGGN